MTNQKVSIYEIEYGESTCSTDSKSGTVKDPLRRFSLDQNLVKDQATEIIKIRHLALKDQLQSLEKRRSEVLFLINRYKQAEYINEDAIRNLKRKEGEYSKDIVNNPSLCHVLDAIRDKIKLNKRSVQVDKASEKAYIRELFLVNERYEKAYIDLCATEYILNILKENRENKN